MAVDSNFVYENQDDAEADLERHSREIACEYRALYLVFCTSGMRIQSYIPTDVNRVHQIALNGRVFSPK